MCLEWDHVFSMSGMLAEWNRVCFYKCERFQLHGKGVCVRVCGGGRSVGVVGGVQVGCGMLLGMVVEGRSEWGSEGRG